MEIICIEKRAWDSVLEQIDVLTTEVETMKKESAPEPGEH